MLLVIPVLLFTIIPVAAQEGALATPPGMVLASDCQAEPRPLEDFSAIVDATPGSFAELLEGTPIATAVPPTGGVPAEPAVVEEINTAIEQIGACTATTDVRLFSALWTDDFFRRTLSGTDLSNVLGATPVPIQEPIPLPVIDEVRVLPDGRITAMGRSEDGMGVFVFVESEGRYLLDDSFNLSLDGTPTP